MFQPLLTVSNGIRYWTIHGNFHRTDGPAVEYPSGDNYWYLYGKPSRINGPAVEYANGAIEWWYNGEHFYAKSDYYQELLNRNLISKEDTVLEVL